MSILNCNFWKFMCWINNIQGPRISWYSIGLRICVRAHKIFLKKGKSYKKIILVCYESLWKNWHGRKCFVCISEKLLESPFSFGFLFFICRLFTLLPLKSQFYFFFSFLFLKSLDKVVMEMSTCEEPRAPNGPSPIATASGQRSVMVLPCNWSKKVWNYIVQIDCKF